MNLNLPAYLMILAVAGSPSLCNDKKYRCTFGGGECSEVSNCDECERAGGTCEKGGCNEAALVDEFIAFAEGPFTISIKYDSPGYDRGDYYVVTLDSPQIEGGPPARIGVRGDVVPDGLGGFVFNGYSLAFMPGMRGDLAQNLTVAWPAVDAWCSQARTQIGD